MTLTTALKVLDTFFGYQSRYSNKAGFQVAIRKSGRLIFSEAYGLANIESGRKYTTRHLAHAASHSKVFAAALTLMLAEEGILKLNDTVVSYLPALNKGKDKRFKSITIEHLVTNRSGILRDGESFHWEVAKPFPSKSRLMELLSLEPLYYEPGTVTKYSNIGFSLLGLVLETAAGRPYDVLLQDYIFSKLPEAVIRADYSPGDAKFFADGHSLPFYNGRMKIFKHQNTKAMLAAAGICANAETLSDFLAKLYFSDIFLSAESRKKILQKHWPMHYQKNAFYGYGTMFSREGGNLYIGHSGGFAGFTSMTRHVANSDCIFSIIFNSMGVTPLEAMRSMAETLQLIEKIFDDKRAPEVTVPMMNKWGTDIWIVGKTKALRLRLGSWLLCDKPVVFSKRKNGKFYTEEISGYEWPNEPVEFIRENGKITLIDHAGTPSWREKDFLKRNQAFA